LPKLGQSNLAEADSRGKCGTVKGRRHAAVAASSNIASLKAIMMLTLLGLCSSRRRQPDVPSERNSPAPHFEGATKRPLDSGISTSNGKMAVAVSRVDLRRGSDSLSRQRHDLLGLRRMGSTAMQQGCLFTDTCLASPAPSTDDCHDIIMKNTGPHPSARHSFG
jgi:hypothetical protein